MTLHAYNHASYAVICSCGWDRMWSFVALNKLAGLIEGH